MRCPNCDQWNRASLPRCIRCGAELHSDTPVTPSWRAQMSGEQSAGKAYIRVDEDGQADVTPDRRDVLAAQMTELKARKDDGEIRLQQLMADTAEPAAEAAPASAEEDAPSAFVPPVIPEAQRRTARVAIHGLNGTQELPQAPAAPQTTGRQRTVRHSPLAPGQWQDSRTYDPIVEEMQQQNVFRNAPQLSRQQTAPRGRSRRRSKRRIVNGITALLVIAVICLAGVIGVTAFQQYKAAQSDKNKALVTASMKDDLAAHTILIPGEDGQKIYIRELHQTFEVIGGFATIVIADHDWYDDLEVVTEETMTVTLTPSLQTSGARHQKTLDPITYDITIPLSPIELVTPEQMRTEVTTAMYSMQFRVRPGSTVSINGVDMSDAVDEAGLLVYNATVQPKGDNLYTLNVRSPYCRDNSMEVVLYREVQEIPLDLAATTYTSTSLSEYQITCTTLPGAEVDILSPHTDLVITNLDTTGEFSFYAVFEKIGYNTVSIQATYPGKKTSRVDYVIYYLPNQDVYTRKAWSLTKAADYAELTGNITFRAEKSQIYVAMGQFDSFVSQSPQLAIMYCSEDGLSQPVLLENQTKTTWEKGKYYRIYADVYGSYNGMPWLVARYTYLD